MNIAEFDIFSFRPSKQLSNLDHFHSTSTLQLRLFPGIHRHLRTACIHTQRKLSNENLYSKYSDPKEITKERNNEIKGDFNDAVVEISPDTIDKLATEAFIQKRTHYQVSNNTQKYNDTSIKEKPSQEVHQEKSLLVDLMKGMSKTKAPIYDHKSEFDVKNDKGYFKSLRSENLSIRKEPDIEIPKSRPKEPWMIEKERIKEKYPSGYRPLKRLSPDAIDGIRALHSQMPEHFTTARLAKEFKISPEAIRRILKSKWRPNIDEAQDREARWSRRGEQIWSRWAELGATPPKKIRRLGIGEKHDPSYYQPDPLPNLITTSTRRKSEETDFSKSRFRKGRIL